MGFSYRKIQAEINFAPVIWEREQRMPRWFADASKTWTPTKESFIEFFRRCKEIYGLFVNDDLAACIYLEYGADEVNVHISVIRAVDEDVLVRFFQSVRRLKHADGVPVSTGWLLERNRGMIRIAERAGYRRTGLKLTYGQSRGRSLTWIQVCG